MITGFNTDVDFDGRVFHVQTEDKGLDNPIVESLVYCGGEIVESRRLPYADLAEGGGLTEDELLMRMEVQHQGLIREIRSGKFDTENIKPFGHNIISNHSLDEVVLGFLQKEDELRALQLETLDDIELRHGSDPTVRLRVVEETTRRAIAGAQVKFSLISNKDKPHELFAGETNDEGFVEASFTIPVIPGAELAVLCRATAAGCRTVLRQAVHPPEDTE